METIQLLVLSRRYNYETTSPFIHVLSRSAGENHKLVSISYKSIYSARAYGFYGRLSMESSINRQPIQRPDMSCLLGAAEG